MRFITLCIALSCLLSWSPGVFAGCGSANCPLNSYRPMGAGWLLLEFSHEYINQNRIYTGSTLSVVGAIPGDHDEVQTLNSLDRLSINAGLSDRLSSR